MAKKEFKNFKELASHVSLKEKGKSRVHIGDVREILSILRRLDKQTEGKVSYILFHK